MSLARLREQATPPLRIAGIPPGVISASDWDVTDEVLALWPDMAQLLIDWDPLIEWLAHGMCLEPGEDGRSTCEGECVTCKARSSHPRFAVLDGQAKDTT